MKIILGYGTIFLIICSPLFGNSTTNLNTYLKYVLTNHAKPKEFKTTVRSAAADYAIASAFTDVVITTSLSKTHAEPFQTSPFVPASVETISGQLSLVRPILATGGNLSISLQKNRVSQPSISAFNGMSINQPIFYDTSLSLSYTQPLLHGFMGETYKLPILIASKNVETAKLTSNEAMETFLVSEISQFIDWVLLNETTELSYSRLQLARQSYDQTKEQVRVNLSEKIDLLRAEAAMERAHQFWLTQKAHLKSFQFKLASKQTNNQLLQTTPVFPLYDFVEIKQPNHIIIHRLRSVVAFSNSHEILEKQLALRKSQRNGSLNLTGRANILGGNTKHYESFNLNKDNTSVAIEYSRPLSDTATIQQIEKKNQELTQYKHNQAQLKNDLESEIIGLHTLIEEHKRLLEINLNQIILAKQQADAENELYKQGRTSLDMVIQSQDNVLNTKLNYANLSAAYQKHVLNYQALTDELLAKHTATL
jgi:outer membrane protein TolC